MKFEDIVEGKEYKIAGGWIHFFKPGTVVTVVRKWVDYEPTGEAVEFVECETATQNQVLLPEDLEEIL